jgi:transcriptional regulator with XRE-family HTH domain
MSTFLEFLMEQSGLSQNKLARLSGLNQARISLITNAKVEATRGEKKKLEQFFELPSQDLLEEVTLLFHASGISQAKQAGR